MTRIKVSGITNPKDAEQAARAGAHIVACVFHAGSPRYVTLEQAWAVKRSLPGEVEFYGIFPDSPVPLVTRIAQHCGLARAQLFGNETREEVDAVPGAFKAVSCTSVDEVDDAVKTHAGRRTPAPSLLIHLTGDVGGDWNLAARATRRGDVILAARDLSAAAVETAITTAHPWAVDVWDAVETRPGHLDWPRLTDFVASVRAADSVVSHKPSRSNGGDK